MNYNIGKKLRDLRKYLHITQAELAEGICSQAMISKIEKHEEIYPSAELLYQLSQRLGVPIDYFFQEIELLNISYVNDVCDQLTHLILYKNYEEAYQIVKSEKKNAIFQEKHLKRYLLWREAICVAHVDNDFQTALELLDQALDLSGTTEKNYSLEELDILTSKAIFYSNNNNMEAASELFETILHHATRSVYQKGRTTIINIYYNYARTEFFLKNYKKCVDLANSGIKICKGEQSLFSLGHLYYQKAEGLYMINGGATPDIISIYKDSLWVFTQLRDEKVMNIIETKIKNLESTLQHQSSK